MDRIDAIEFARLGKTVEKVLPLATFPRLHDRLVNTEGAVQYCASGYVDSLERPRLRLEVSTAVNMICQRCMGTMNVPFNTISEVVLAADEAQLTQWDEDEDEVVLADQKLSLAELVEDELLLGLPFAPRHNDDGCRAADGEETPKRANPFAVLATLKKPN